MTFWNKLSKWQRFWLVAAVLVYGLVDLSMMGGLTLTLLTLAWVALELTFDMVMTVVPMAAEMLFEGATHAVGFAGVLTEYSEHALRGLGMAATLSETGVLYTAWAIAMGLYALLLLGAVGWVRLLLKKR